MRAKLINGKEMAENIKISLKKQISEFAYPPQLAIVMVGNDDASAVYVRNKQKAAAQIGMVSHFHHLDEDIREEEVIKIISIVLLFYKLFCLTISIMFI